MKHNIYWLGFLIFLGSCKMGKNYEGMEVEVPVAFPSSDSLVFAVDTVSTDSLSADTALYMEWWTMINDPFLDSLIRKALKHNQNALFAAENILQARYALKIQQKELLPKLSLQGNIQRGNFLFNRPGETSNAFIGAGALNWELDFWGKYRRLNEFQRAELLASEQGYRALMLSLISEVSEAYFELLLMRAQLEISERNKSLRDSMTLIIQAKYNRGIIPEIDLNQSQIQYAIAADAVPLYRRRVVQAENALSLLIGELPQPIYTTQKLADETIELNLGDTLPALNLLVQRPDILQAEMRVVGANANVGVAKANRLPGISINGLLGAAAFGTTGLSFSDEALWNVSGAIVGPLFYWGQLARQVDIRESQLLQAKLNYELVVLNAYREVGDLMVQIETLNEQIEIAELRRDAALNAQNLSQERYSRGVTSYLEYLESQRQAFDAELILEGYRKELLSSQMALYKALGGGYLDEND